jgi:hypothetical protein
MTERNRRKTMNDCKECDFFEKVITEAHQRHDNLMEYSPLFSKTARDKLIKINNLVDSMEYEWRKHLYLGICSDKRYFETTCQILRRPKWVINHKVENSII